VLGGAEGPAFLEFKRLFREGFEAARKHCDRIITLVELMQRGERIWLRERRTEANEPVVESALPCFAIYGDQTATQLRDRFQPTLTHSLVGDHVERLITASIGSHWTRLYDSVSLPFISPGSVPR
jgi:phosphatidylinositol 4-kinase